MNILIIGCGDTGAQLANTLDELGSQVSVVDQDPAAADALSEDFWRIRFPMMLRDSFSEPDVELPSMFPSRTSSEPMMRSTSAFCTDSMLPLWMKSSIHIEECPPIAQ